MFFAVYPEKSEEGRETKSRSWQSTRCPSCVDACYGLELLPYFVVALVDFTAHNHCCFTSSTRLTLHTASSVFLHNVLCWWHCSYVNIHFVVMLIVNILFHGSFFALK